MGYPFAAGDPVWTRKNTLLFPLVCVGAGLLGGIFGAFFSFCVGGWGRGWRCVLNID